MNTSLCSIAAVAHVEFRSKIVFLPQSFMLERVSFEARRAETNVPSSWKDSREKASNLKEGIVESPYTECCPIIAAVSAKGLRGTRYRSWTIPQSAELPVN